jgi:hypothetical protein
MLVVHTSNYFSCFILQIKNLTNQAQRNSGAASIAVDELRQARSRLDAYGSKIGELESANASLLVFVYQDMLYINTHLICLALNFEAFKIVNVGAFLYEIFVISNYPTPPSFFLSSFLLMKLKVFYLIW